ncbi:BTB/POZ domain-containing protein 9-like [Adelges cooleyi]|uniref:BTB/POZ domain-containing protein 9-like n=1 Tax=Adelges cooleyi TaxID=133065 RepID=UPI0021806B9A|nr:BTB/POZ domain-containing protein 9-like [Adelges cooleyi]
MSFSYFLALIILRSIPAFSMPPEFLSSSSNPSGYEQIDHTKFLVTDISSLYGNETFSDVVFVVDNVRLHAHRLMLATRSEYFRKLLLGNYKESQQRDVTISEASLTSFKLLLEYTYTGRINLGVLGDEIISELFIISHYFGFFNLQHSLAEYYSRNINVDNACSLFTAALRYQLKKLDEDAVKFIDNHAMDIFQSKDFLSLSPEAMVKILKRDSFIANELDIFLAVSSWIKNKENQLDPDCKVNVLSAIRYPLMSVDELTSVVRDSQLVDPNTISDAIQFIKTMPLHKFKFRGRRNVRLAYSYQTTSGTTDAVTIIKLDHPSTINYIEMNLYSNDTYSWYSETGNYSYYIEVSMDQNDWVRVIDYSNYDCRLTQRLWFYPRVLQYVRFVGTCNTDNKAFNVLEIKYNTKEMYTVEIENGFVAPKYNVVTISMDAAVLAEYRFTNNLMLNGHIEYNLNNYNCHRLNSGCIVVQLAQPYMLCSMRMLFVDEDGGELRYIVEVSVNSQNWEEIVDESNEFPISWQLLQFKCRPIVYIRITGINDSAYNYFHCEELEAPAQAAPDSNFVEVDSDVSSYEENNETEIIMREAIAEAPVA